MRNILFQWVHEWIIPPWWMARAFYDVQRDRTLFVIFPLNIVVVFAWWIQDKWARAAHAPSWIDREANRRRDRDHEIPF